MTGHYLEDHPSWFQWLITMVNKSLKDRVVPLPNGRTPWLINGGQLVVSTPLKNMRTVKMGEHLPQRSGATIPPKKYG